MNASTVHLYREIIDNSYFYKNTRLSSQISKLPSLLNTSHIEIFSILCIRFVYAWAVN